MIYFAMRLAGRQGRRPWKDREGYQAGPQTLRAHLMKTNILAVMAVVLVAAGCKPTNAPDTLEGSAVLQVSPADDALDVPTSSWVTLTFQKPVERSTVERSFRLMDERSYPDSLCPVSTTMGHSSMSAAMMDMQRMAHLDSAHALRGTFAWNSDNT